MAVMTTGAMGRLYGAANTLVGQDEMNGRVNPALEADDDLPAEEVKEIGSHARGPPPETQRGGGSDLRSRGAPTHGDTVRATKQANTAF